MQVSRRQRVHKADQLVVPNPLPLQRDLDTLVGPDDDGHKYIHDEAVPVMSALSGLSSAIEGYVVHQNGIYPEGVFGRCAPARYRKVPLAARIPFKSDALPKEAAFWGRVTSEFCAWREGCSSPVRITTRAALADKVFYFGPQIWTLHCLWLRVCLFLQNRICLSMRFRLCSESRSSSSTPV